jgi:hypothetical protein
MGSSLSCAPIRHGACVDPYKDFKPRQGLETWDPRQRFSGNFLLLNDVRA